MVKAAATSRQERMQHIDYGGSTVNMNGHAQANPETWRRLVSQDKPSTEEAANTAADGFTHTTPSRRSICA